MTYKKPFGFIPGALERRFYQERLVKSDLPEEFAISGDERKWHGAEAMNEGGSIARGLAVQSEGNSFHFLLGARLPFRTDSLLGKP